MENDQYRKKVYMQTLSSTLISHRANLLPQWTTDNILVFPSAYEFASYNIQNECIEILPRDPGQNEVLYAQFKAEVNSNKFEMHYVFRSEESFYFADSNQRNQNILLYRNTFENRQHLAYEILDVILNEQEKSNPIMVNRTLKIIQEVNNPLIMQNERKKERLQQMQSIKQFYMVHECNFAVMVVEMKTKNGIMLVNLIRSRHQKTNKFNCPVVEFDMSTSNYQISQSDKHSSKIIYIYEDAIISIHKTRDITQFVVLTDKSIELIKLNYDSMSLYVLHKFNIKEKLKGIICSIGVTNIRSDIFIVTKCQAEVQKQDSTKFLNQGKLKKNLKLLTVVNNGRKQIVEIEQQMILKSNFNQKSLKFLEDSDKVISKVKFKNDIIRNNYEIQEEDDCIPDINQNLILTVFNKMVVQQQKKKKKIVVLKEKSVKNINQVQDESIETSKQITCKKTIKQLANFVVNKHFIILWEKNECTIHLCKLVSKRQQQEKYRNDKQDIKIINNNDLQSKQKQMKELCARLVGLTMDEEQENQMKFQSKIEYVMKIQLELPCAKICAVSVSPNNYNLLIVSSTGNEHKETYFYNIFQLQLFIQLPKADPNMFIKPIKNIYKKKAVEQINNSLVRDSAIFLSGNLIHSTDNQILDGALFFDIHPYHLFLAVSFGFRTKIYAIDGNERLISLHTINRPGIKSVKYSPLGNHLCLLFSKSIKIINVYSFNEAFSIPQKNSNFIKCGYSSNGMQFYTLSQNHTVNVYNSFDYSKIDSIKPTSQIFRASQFRPTSIRSFTKQSQYCLVLQNGGLYVKFKNQAIVVESEHIYHYDDGEKIVDIQIDQLNGILFAGCLSGKLRAHLWPIKQQHEFQFYSEMRTSFGPISSLSLSRVEPYIYVGGENGNISKIKYIIDRDIGNFNLKHTSVLMNNGIKYLSMADMSCIKRIYRYILVNNSNLCQQIPEKLRLQYKLSQVISKLNQEMKRLKAQIQKELTQKQKVSNEKFDVNLYLHLNRIITSKLHSQMSDQLQSNYRSLFQLKNKFSKEISKIQCQRQKLMKQKSLTISKYFTERTQLKDKNNLETQAHANIYQSEVKKIAASATYTEIVKDMREEVIFCLPNDEHGNYQQQKRCLNQQLQSENHRYYELRKQCAYKETAIKGLQDKKIKEETVDFKIQLQSSQMNKKMNYNHEILSQLMTKIQEAEQKVHKVQDQSQIIKANISLKKISNADINDACQYKLWVSEKIEAEISQMVAYYKLLEETLDEKSSEIIDLINVKTQRIAKVEELSQQVIITKLNLKKRRNRLLDSHTGLKKIDLIKDFYFFKTKTAGSSPKSHQGAQYRCVSSSRQCRGNFSSRKISTINKQVTASHNVFEKSMKFLKHTVKIHQRKIHKFGKQNGELLNEYQNLKFENKHLEEAEITNKRSIQQISGVLKQTEKQKQQPRMSRPPNQLAKKSFQKYLQAKGKRQKPCLKYRTATSSPTHLFTPLNFQLL